MIPADTAAPLDEENLGAVLAEVLPRSPDDENELPDDVQEAS